MQRFSLLTLVAVSLTVLGFPQAARSQVLTLSFAGGQGTTSVDQYTGTSGSGWISGWSTAVTSSSTFSGSVANASPVVPGGGNYLAATVTTTGTSAPQATVFRQYDGTSSGVDVSLDHTISFDFRGGTTLVSATSQSYNLFASTNSSRSGLDNTDTWAFKVENGTWRVMSGNNAGGGAYLNTGMNFAAGTTYSFTVSVDADTKTYTASIYNGSSTYTSGTLGFRSSSAVDGSYLYFGASGSDSGQSYSFSLDNLNVVPEPSGAFLAVGALAFLPLIRRRVHRSC